MTKRFAVAFLFLTLDGTMSGAQEMLGGLTATGDTDWTGFYVGAGIGRGWIDQIETDFLGMSDTVDGDDLDYDVTGRSVHAGYLHDFGTLVVGAELEYGRLDFDADFTVWTIQEDNDLTRLKARTGYDAGRALPYAVLGYGWMDGGAETHEGVVFGVGVDYLVTPNVILGFEFLRNKFSFTDIGPTHVDDTGIDHLYVDTLNLRVSYRF